MLFFLQAELSTQYMPHSHALGVDKLARKKHKIKLLKEESSGTLTPPTDQEYVA